MKVWQTGKASFLRRDSGTVAVPRPVARPVLGLFLLLNCLFLAPGRTAESNPELSPEAAQAAAGKLQRVREDSRAGRSFGSVRISQAEANSYLSYEVGPSLPSGVSEVRLEFRPTRPRGTAQVDFDKLRAASSAPPSPVFDYLLRGVHTLGVEGTLYGSQGVGEFQLETVRLDDIPVPEFVVEFLIERYLKPRYPNAVLNRSFLLPYSIETLNVEAGSVLLVARAPQRL